MLLNLIVAQHVVVQLLVAVLDCCSSLCCSTSLSDHKHSVNISIAAVVARSPRYYSLNIDLLKLRNLVMSTWVLMHTVAQLEVEERVEEVGRSPQIWVKIDCLDKNIEPLLLWPWGAGTIWSRCDPPVQGGAVVAFYRVGIVDSHSSRHVGKGSSNVWSCCARSIQRMCPRVN